MSVWNAFLEALDDRGPTISLLEVGGGTGATLRRCLRTLPQQSFDRVRYTLVDDHAGNLQTARTRTRNWAQKSGFLINEDTPDGYRLDSATDTRIEVQFEHADLFTYGERREESDQFDAVIAQAVADRYKPSAFVKALGHFLREDGLWYLPIHFDGMTAFEPTVDNELDQEILDCYHQSMPAPNCGRALLTALRAANAELLSVGASDWIVHGTPNGDYQKQEGYFLHCILYFVSKEIRNGPCNIPQDRFEGWLRKRRKQIEQGSLIYLAHQLDFCAISTK